MGFFSSLKKNFEHGGVNVSLQVPASASMQDASMPVTVSVTASDSQASIKSIRVEVIAESRDRAFSNPTPTGIQEDQYQWTIAHSDYNQPFVVMPGETKTIPINITMNQSKEVESQQPQGSGTGAVAYAVEQLQSLSERLNQNNYSYYVEAVADVEGVALDPSDRQDIQILNPGQFGTGFNVKL